MSEKLKNAVLIRDRLIDIKLRRIVDRRREIEHDEKEIIRLIVEIFDLNASLSGQDAYRDNQNPNTKANPSKQLVTKPQQRRPARRQGGA